MVPKDLRQYITSNADDDEEFTEHLYPTPQEDQQAFMQTWLFFGLLAEFFGLNESDVGERIVDPDTSRAEIDALYRDYVEEEDGVEYLTGAKMLQPQASILIVTRLRLAKPSIEHRIRYLHQCLKFSCFLLNTAIHTEFDPAIRTSIAGLGELLSTGFATATTLKKIPNALVNFSFAWANKYLEDSGDLERHMLENGWCRSEVEKIRSVNQGLGTIHFVSRMRKGWPRRDHRSCSRDGCVAFQLDKETYRPSHAQEGCECELKFVDEPEVQRILTTTTTFPVLRVEIQSGPDAQDVVLKMEVEPYTEGVPYVAISHVWADGMGNPDSNALPGCQIAKVARLVDRLEQAANGTKGITSTENTYRIWVDPLLCPIEIEGKKIALQRIPDVYRNATHVLVLDASLMQYAADALSPAEVLLRIFSSSAWMRRLWTLQEGALAQSLYFQFSDQPITPMDQMAKLSRMGVTDSRYMRILSDVSNEVVHLRGWFRSVHDTSDSGGRPALSLFSLQRTLHFRTVSDPADEPLCIATLLALDQAHVVAASDAQDRMVRVWELVAKKLGGRVPARMLFSSDATLDVPGWRWAPRSLLGASDAARDSMMNINYRMMRFRGVENGGTTGVPTPWGLRVQMGGYVLRSVPLLPRLPLHPWERVAGSHEDMVLVKHVPSGRWLRLMDFYRTEKCKTWTSEERRLYDRKADNPLCRLIDSGRRALLYDREPEKGGVFSGLMVRMEDDWDQRAGAGGEGRRQTLRARRERMLIMDWASPAHSIVADGLHELAMKVAESEVTQQMLQGIDEVQNWDEGRETSSKVKEYMKRVMAEKWKSDPAFVEAVHDARGPDMEEFMWAELQMRFSHNIICEDVAETQVWLID